LPALIWSDLLDLLWKPLSQTGSESKLFAAAERNFPRRGNTHVAAAVAGEVPNPRTLKRRSRPDSA
jgi:hypothetical protein